MIDLANPNVLKVIHSLTAIASIYFLALILAGIVNNRIKDIRQRHNVRKGIAYIATTLILMVVGFVWFHHLKALGVILSIIGAGLVLALQEVILCIAGWALIFIKRPFEAGHRVELGGVKGDVIDVRLFETSLLEIGNWVVDDQSTGRVVHIPNSAVFKGPVFNYNKGFEFIWNEVKIVVTFESDWSKARDVMLKLGEEESKELTERAGSRIRRMARQYMIYYEKFTPIVYTKIEDNGIELSLRYLINVKSRRASTDRVSGRVLEEFKKQKEISFAYPTYRITGVK